MLDFDARIIPGYVRDSMVDVKAGIDFVAGVKA
jgi:hypothetical protein